MALLSSSFSIEVLDGKIEILTVEGVELPISISRVFSTVDDNQHAIAIHVLRGILEPASRNESYAEYLIRRVPEKAEAKAKVQVFFDFDIDETLELRAFDCETGNSLPVTLS